MRGTDGREGWRQRFRFVEFAAHQEGVFLFESWCRLCYNYSVKRILLLLSLAVLADVASARVIDVPAQLVSLFADTEVSTNLVIHPSRTDVRKVKIHLQLTGTEYNDLEIGFGRDVNTNGVLDVEEIETVYGWRGGRYFIENTRDWERIETEAANNDRRGVIDIHLTHGPDFMPKSFEATVRFYDRLTLSS